MTILQPILFKQYIPIKEKAEHLTKYPNKPFRPDISDWIKCQFRMTIYIERQRADYCLNPLNPSCPIWPSLCLEEKCDLTKICDDDPLI